MKQNAGAITETKASLVQTAMRFPGMVFETTMDYAWVAVAGAMFWIVIAGVSYITGILLLVSAVWHSRILGLLLSASFRTRVHERLRDIIWHTPSSTAPRLANRPDLHTSLVAPPPTSASTTSTEPAGSHASSADLPPLPSIPCRHVYLPLRPPCHIQPFNYELQADAPSPSSPLRGSPAKEKKDGLRAAHVRYCHSLPESRPSRGTVVLLHGVSMTSDCWPSYITALNADGWAVVAYDFWGHGDSAVPLASYNPELLVKQLADLLDALSIQDPVHVVGYSLGSLVGLTFTSKSPSRVASLTLIAPAAGLNVAAEDFTGKHFWLNLLHKWLRFYKDVPFMSRVCTPIGDRVLGALARAVGPRRTHLLALHHAQQAPAPARHPLLQTAGTLQWFLALWLWQHARSPRHEVLRSCVCEGALLADAADALTVSAFSKHRLPLFLVFGGEDPLVPASVQQRCRRLFPRAKVLSVPRAGHAVLLHAMPQVREGLRAFLNGSYGAGWEAEAQGKAPPPGSVGISKRT